MIKIKICLCGGGTGGHIYPNISLIKYLKNEFSDIFYLGSIGGVEESIAQANEIPFFGIDACKLERRKIAKNLTIPIKLTKSAIDAKAVLRKLSPDVVFCKGGYVCLPTAVAAKMLGIPVVLHESDRTFGLANKLCLPFAEKILTSFNIDDKFTNVGPLIRDDVLLGKAIEFSNFSYNLPTLLVVGGSSGAAFINDLTELNLNTITTLCNVIHISGKKTDKNTIAKNYCKINYSNNMGDIYRTCDFALSRGGANAIFELLLNKIPSIIIPLSKKASRGDQIDNAKYFAEKQCLKMLSEEDCDNINNELLKLLESATKYRKNIAQLKLFNGTKSTAEILIATAKKYHREQNTTRRSSRNY